MSKSRNLMQIIALCCALIIILTANPFGILIGFTIVMAIAIIYNRSALKRVGKIKFWIISLVIILSAGLLLGKNPRLYYGLSISLEGLWAGLLMNVRAFSILLAMLQLAQKIKRDRILSLTGNLGLPQFAPAFETALESLPYIKEVYSDRDTTTKSRFQTVVNILLFADELARQTVAKNVTVFAVTGKRAQGKTTFIKEFYKYCCRNNIKAGGFIQERHFSESEDKNIYNIVNLTSKQTLKIAQQREIAQSGYDFINDSFRQAGLWLREAVAKYDLLLVDEMGILESRGIGHTAVIKRCLENYPCKIWVITLRKDKQNPLMRLFNISADHIFDLDNPEINRDDIINKIKSSLENISRNSADQ